MQNALKALLRKAACRSIDELCKTMGTLIDPFKPEECKNYFKAPAYHPV